MCRKSHWIVTLPLVIVVALAAPRAPVAQEIEAQIAEVRAQFLEHYGARDAEALSALFDERASFAGTLQPFWLRGREAINDLWQRYFAAHPSVRMILRDPVVESYGDPVHTTVETGYLEMYMTDTGGRTTPTFIRYSITRVNTQGQWLIASMYVGRLPGSD